MKTKVKIFEKFQNDLNLETLKEAIIKQYGSVYQYAKTHNLHESTVSAFLNKRRDISLKALTKHATLLGRKVKISFPPAE